MERILITGGAGFIGSWLAEALLKTGRYHLTVLDNLSTGKRAHLPEPNTSSWSWIEGDVNHRSTMEACMGDGGFDFVFHYAAVVGVQRTQEHPMKVLEDIDGLKNILKHCMFNMSRKRLQTIMEKKYNNIYIMANAYMEEVQV